MLAVRQATDPLLDMISTLDHDIYRVRVHVHNDDVGAILDDLRSESREDARDDPGVPAMNVEKRSPWVVLGIPFPATKAEANRAFARRSRTLRRNSDLPWTQEDLSWALAQITLAEENPESTIEHFRVPADPGVFERPGPDDLFVPAPEPIARRTEPAAPDALNKACARAAVDALRVFLSALDADPIPDPYARPAAASKERVT